MRKKGKILAYIASGMMLALALLFLFIGVSALTASEYEYDQDGNMVPRHFEEVGISRWIGYRMLIIGMVVLVPGILGLVGAISISKNNRKAIILLNIACAISLLSIIGFIPFVLFIIASDDVSSAERKQKKLEEKAQEI